MAQGARSVSPTGNQGASNLTCDLGRGQVGKYEASLSMDLSVRQVIINVSHQVHTTFWVLKQILKKRGKSDKEIAERRGL